MDRVTAIGAALCLLVVLSACSTGTATAWTYAPLTRDPMALAVASAEAPQLEQVAAASPAVPAQAAAASPASLPSHPPRPQRPTSSRSTPSSWASSPPP